MRASRNVASHAHAAVTAAWSSRSTSAGVHGPNRCTSSQCDRSVVHHQRVGPSLVVHASPIGRGQVAVSARVGDGRVVVELHPQRLEVVDAGRPVDVALHEVGGLAGGLEHEGSHDRAVPAPHAREVVHGEGLSGRVLDLRGRVDRLETSSHARSEVPRAPTALERGAFGRCDRDHSHARTVRPIADGGIRWEMHSFTDPPVRGRLRSAQGGARPLLARGV